MAKMGTKDVKGKAAEPEKEAVEQAIQEGREKAEVKRGTTGELKDGSKVNQASRYAVRFGVFPNEGAIKGVCSVTINDEFCVKNVRLVEGSNGMFVAMPSYKSGDEYKDIFFPVTKEARSSIQEAVIKEYELQMQIHQADAVFGGARMQQEAPMAGDLPGNVIQ
ncbi:MAG: SpoVG family protein [Lachnospiraceae bacterium]|nr:SpoVG family protein [Lachnospiraceae bacterium]